jgi:hypothetical protein
LPQFVVDELRRLSKQSLPSPGKNAFSDYFKGIWMAFAVYLEIDAVGFDFEDARKELAKVLTDNTKNPAISARGHI